MGGSSTTMKQYIKTFNFPDNIDDVYVHIKSQQTWGKGPWTDNDGKQVEMQLDDDCSAFAPEYEHPLLDIVMNNCIEAGKEYQKHFPYIVLTGGSVPRYNRYETGQRMHRHVDHIYSCFDGEQKGIPVISLIGFLNDDYEGGELVFTLDAEKYVMKPKRGDIVVFPSAFPWEHEVLPVVSGERYSFVSWCW